jgi:hypothetical protein
MPKAVSNALQAASGSHIFGSVESINAYIGFSRRSLCVVPMYDMDWIPTTISRVMSSTRLKVAELGVKRDVSYPPKISCDNCPDFSPTKMISREDFKIWIHAYDSSLLLCSSSLSLESFSSISKSRSKREPSSSQCDCS